MDKYKDDLAEGGLRPNWMEFCEKHARKAAEEFLDRFLVFLKHYPTSEIRPKEPVDYARKFVEYFLDHFEKKVNRNSSENHNKILDSYPGSGNDKTDGGAESSMQFGQVNQPDPTQNGFSSGQPLFRTISDIDEDQFHDHSSLHDDYSDQEQGSITSEQPPLNITHPLNKHKGSILKRFSFRKIKKKGLFKQNSDEVGLAVNSSDNYSKDKQETDRKVQKRNKTTKVSKNKHVVQHPPGNVRKEGIVHVLTGEDSKGKSRWEKTRLVLVQLNESYNLEFYSPPKVLYKNVLNILQFVLIWLKILVEHAVTKCLSVL